VTFWERLGLEHPVVQAGMGGGVAGGALAGAVSAAGGLGTVGIMAPRPFARALGEARRAAPGRPLAANLLVPFTRKAHVDACIAADVSLVVLHGGLAPRWAGALRASGIPVLPTVGTVEEARAALASGAEGLVVQGLEAGGHLAGVEPVESALAQVLEVSDGRVPVLAAGGVADKTDVRRLLDLGATAAVAGTRFLLTDESLAHPGYKQRVLDAERTLVTLLFGIGWPMRHRVVPNPATERWCSVTELAPRWVQGLGRMTAPLGRALPMTAVAATGSLQRPGLPFFSPGLPLAGMPDASLDYSALYAGETIHRLHDVVPAAEAVARLAP
jgi:NAD(P)H-dependent flavin oxidoreductase YrpB (nitropropane dioxygenase family)